MAKSINKISILAFQVQSFKKNLDIFSLKYCKIIWYNCFFLQKILLGDNFKIDLFVTLHAVYPFFKKMLHDFGMYIFPTIIENSF